MSIERRLMDEVERLRGDIIEYTRGMVRIPSENPPGDEAEVSDYVSELLASLGFDVEQVESKPKRVNTLALLEGAGGGKSLLWHGHYDTVPVGNLDNWTVDPFGGEVKDGRIYGRGSGDMKGAIASVVVAAKAWATWVCGLGGASASTPWRTRSSSADTAPSTSARTGTSRAWTRPSWERLPHEAASSWPGLPSGAGPW